MAPKVTVAAKADRMEGVLPAVYQNLTQDVTLSTDAWTEVSTPLNASTTMIRIAAVDATGAPAPIRYRIRSSPTVGSDVGTLLPIGHEYRPIFPGQSVAFKRGVASTVTVNVEEALSV